jgi:hypothetical protein
MCSSSTKKKKYKQSFRTILDKALNISSDAQITVVYDESFLCYFDALSEVVNEKLLSVTYIFIPISYQHAMQGSSRFLLPNEDISLPTSLSVALSNSDVILNFLNGDINSSKVRGAVIDKKNKNCKLVHCPGLSEEILNLILISPFKKILQHSEQMAWALGNAKTAELITADSKGNEYSLCIDMQGWDNEPTMSPGVILHGSWGNIPPGETFCCPEHKGVEGKICVNGSLPGHVLKKDEDCVLTFRQGKLVKWEPLGSVPSKFFTNLESESQKKKDKNWNTFAELGIGLNPSIKRLTGNSLFDEKMAGTIHIAIGDNVVFGHPIDSLIHADLVSVKPTLLLDGRKVIDKGNLNIRVISEWRKRPQFEMIIFEDSDVVSIKATRVKVVDGSIKRRLYKKDRVTYVNIVSSKHKSLTNILKEILQEDNEIVFIDLVKRVGSRNRKTLKSILQMLHHYKIINVIKPSSLKVNKSRHSKEVA